MTTDLREPGTSAWPWPASLDALSAAPHHHTLIMENDRVRVLETRIPPGDIVPVHTHCWPSVLYVLSWSGVTNELIWHVIYGASPEDAKLRVAVNARNGEFMRVEK